jgi:hypothetical protein
VVYEIGTCIGTVLLLGERPYNCSDKLAEWLLSSKQYTGNIEYVASLELLLTRVAFGGGVGIVSEAIAELYRRQDLVIRPLLAKGALVTTFLHSRNDGPLGLITRFVERMLTTGA